MLTLRKRNGELLSCIFFGSPDTSSFPLPPPSLGWIMMIMIMLWTIMMIMIMMTLNNNDDYEYVMNDNDDYDYDDIER